MKTLKNMKTPQMIEGIGKCTFAATRPTQGDVSLTLDVLKEMIKRLKEEELKIEGAFISNSVRFLKVVPGFHLGVINLT